MASFAAQAALRTHYEELIDSTEDDIANGLKSAVSWIAKVLHYFLNVHLIVSFSALCTFFIMRAAATQPFYFVLCAHIFNIFIFRKTPLS